MQSCFPGYTFAPSRRVQLWLLHTPHSVVADSPLLFKLNESSSLSFSIHITQEAWGLLGTGLVASARLTMTLLKPSFHCGLQYWTQYPRCDFKWQLESKNHFPQPDGYALANTAQHANSLLGCKGTLQSSTCPQTEAQGLFLQSWFLASQSPYSPAVWANFILNMGFCICLALNFMRFLSILSRSHSKEAQPSSALTAPTKLLSSVDLLRIQQIHLLN